MSLRWPPKAQYETLDFSLDWSRALDTDETIQEVSWYIIDNTGERVFFGVGVTVDTLKNLTQSSTNTVTTIYLQDGTYNQEYHLYCNIFTSSSRVKERSVKIRIREYN
jgi:hypothetical protein